MNYVNITKRIIVLLNAYSRAISYDNKHSNSSISDAFEDKIYLLQQQVLTWIKDSHRVHVRSMRRQQVKLACKLLHCDYYRIYR